MREIRQGRWTADIDGDFVVFIIGARINQPWRLVQGLRDLGGRRGIGHMLDRLVQQPEKGLLGYERTGTTFVQYWRSFEQLEAFAKDADDAHLDLWRSYWKRVGSSTRTGIWHETFLVRNGEYEAVYGNMPAHGLGKATSLVRVGDGVGARQRLRVAATNDAG